MTRQDCLLNSHPRVVKCMTTKKSKETHATRRENTEG